MKIGPSHRANLATVKVINKTNRFKKLWQWNWFAICKWYHNDILDDPKNFTKREENCVFVSFDTDCVTCIA